MYLYLNALNFGLTCCSLMSSVLEWVSFGLHNISEFWRVYTRLFIKASIANSNTIQLVNTRIFSADILHSEYCMHVVDKIWYCAFVCWSLIICMLGYWIILIRQMMIEGSKCLTSSYIIFTDPSCTSIFPLMNTDCVALIQWLVRLSATPDLEQAG